MKKKENIRIKIIGFRVGRPRPSYNRTIDFPRDLIGVDKESVLALFEDLGGRVFSALQRSDFLSIRKINTDESFVIGENDFMCLECGRDCYPDYENREEWKEGGCVKVIDHKEIKSSVLGPAHTDFIVEITCKKCGNRIIIEDSSG